MEGGSGFSSGLASASAQVIQQATHKFRGQAPAHLTEGGIVVSILLRDDLKLILFRAVNQRLSMDQPLRPSSLPPVANLFPGVLAAIDQDFNSM